MKDESTKITTKFNEFKQKQVDKEINKKNKQNLSTDIIAVQKLQDGSYEKISGPIKVIQLTGIVTDISDIKKIEEGMTIDSTLSVGKIERGQMFYLTALLEKSGVRGFTNQTLGVVQVRVIDYWYGLSILNSVVKKK